MDWPSQVGEEFVAPGVVRRSFQRKAHLSWDRMDCGGCGAGGEGCEEAVGTEPNAQEGRRPGHVACGREGPHMKGRQTGSSRR